MQCDAGKLCNLALTLFMFMEESQLGDHSKQFNVFGASGGKCLRQEKVP